MVPELALLIGILPRNQVTDDVGQGSQSSRFHTPDISTEVYASLVPCLLS
jgi:hypothetical protein